jgi:acetyl esterase/lipase
MGFDNETPNPETLSAEPGPMDVASTAPLSVSDSLDADESVSLPPATGETIEVAQQIQLYAPNDLLKHPLVSPALSYLGGLPPLFFIAGDREVLRDEIIYACVLPSTFRVSGSPPTISIGPTGLRIRNDFLYVRR